MLGLLLSPGRITPRRSSAWRSSAGLHPHLRRPAAVGAGQRGRAAACRGASWPSCPGPGCAARCPIVLTTIPLVRGGRRRRAALRHRLRDGRHLHAADRADAAVGRPAAAGRPALRAARPRRRGGAAGADRGRPAPGHDQPGLADARRRGRRAAAARRGLGVAGHPATARSLVPERAHRRCGTATTCSSSPRARLREATEERLRQVSGGRPARAVARPSPRRRADVDAVSWPRAGCRTSTSLDGGRPTCAPFGQASNAVARPRRRRRGRAARRSTYDLGGLAELARPPAGRPGSRGSSVQICDAADLGPSGALPLSPSTKPRVDEQLHGARRPARCGCWR